MNVNDIKVLQRNLGVKVDGKFGPETISAIKAFQKKNGLVVDGIAGPHTRKALSESTTPPSEGARKEPDKAAINSKLPKLSIVRGIAQPYDKPIKLLDTARPINEIILHCAATPEGKWFDRNDVNAWHKQRGWSMIGYHYLVLLDGTIQTGRPIGMVGAHVEGHNENTIGICYIGGLTANGKAPKDTRTQEQINATFWLASELVQKFKIKKPIKGHNEYDAGKACPSYKVKNDPIRSLKYGDK